MSRSQILLQSAPGNGRFCFVGLLVFPNMTEKYETTEKVPQWEKVSHADTAVRAIGESFTIRKQYKSDALGIIINEKTTKIYMCAILKSTYELIRHSGSKTRKSYT